MLNGIEVLCHSSIRIGKKKVIYFDPFNVKKNYNDADIIFVTHDHYDHYDEESILKVKKNNTVIVVPVLLEEKAKKIFDIDNIILVEPNKKYEVLGITFETVRAYNNEKNFHPKEKNWVGYIITLDDKRYYIMGDTDDTVDARKVECDVVFVPIGGIYTMNKEEAVSYVNYIKPFVAVPIHYGMVSGTRDDAEYFVDNIDEEIIGKILINI